MVYKNNKKNKNTIYPIFLECVELTTDEYWKNLYTNLARDKCPKMIYIKDWCIHSSNNNKKHEFKYNFQNKTAEEISVDLYNLLIQYTNISSDTDKEKKKLELEQCRNELLQLKNAKWKSIKKNIKNQLIENYVIDMQHKYKLNWNSTIELKGLIKSGLLWKCQESKDIIYVDGKIKEIKGIVYCNILKKFINTNLNKRITITKDKEIYRCLYFNWPKTIKCIWDFYKE